MKKNKKYARKRNGSGRAKTLPKKTKLRRVVLPDVNTYLRMVITIMWYLSAQGDINGLMEQNREYINKFTDK